MFDGVQDRRTTCLGGPKQNLSCLCLKTQQTMAAPQAPADAEEKKAIERRTYIRPTSRLTRF